MAFRPHTPGTATAEEGIQVKLLPIPITLRAALHRAALLSLLFPLASTAALAQISLSVQIAPPPLPIYVQPEVPGEGYLWTPGYWGWGEDINEYYWVPGTWVLAPQPGYLWTPGYWGF
jgi:hypothetical protein